MSHASSKSTTRTDKLLPLFNCLYPQYTGGAFAGMCYDPRGISPTILTMGGGNRQPYILIWQEKIESNTNTETTEA